MAITLTPAVKGLLTKAMKSADKTVFSANATNKHHYIVLNVRSAFGKLMPREQAKHAARKYLASV